MAVRQTADSSCSTRPPLNVTHILNQSPKPVIQSYVKIDKAVYVSALKFFSLLLSSAFRRARTFSEALITTKYLNLISTTRQLKFVHYTYDADLHGNPPIENIRLDLICLLYVQNSYGTLGITVFRTIYHYQIVHNQCQIYP